MNSSDLLNLLRALAGNPHDCCWSHLPFSSSSSSSSSSEEITTCTWITEVYQIPVADEVWKMNLYSIYHGYAGYGAGSKVCLYAVMHSATGWVTAMKSTLYGVVQGYSGRGAVNKTNLYAVIST